MSEENKAKYRRVVEEAASQGNLDVLDELVSKEFVYHEPGSPEFRGPDGFKQMLTMYRTAFPDLHMHVEDQIAEGDTVVTRWTAHGTHGGDLAGLPATGKEIHISGIAIDRFADGMIVEEWESFDGLGMMQQLGVVPTD